MNAVAQDAPTEVASFRVLFEAASPLWDLDRAGIAKSMVLVAGGGIFEGSVSAELYDPASGTWTETGDLVNVRFVHTATLLSNGKVLAAGGDGGSQSPTLRSAELYDPESWTWTRTDNLIRARQSHTATLLQLNGEFVRDFVSQCHARLHLNCRPAISAG